MFKLLFFSIGEENKENNTSRAVANDDYVVRQVTTRTTGVQKSRIFFSKFRIFISNALNPPPPKHERVVGANEKLIYFHTGVMVYNNKF